MTRLESHCIVQSELPKFSCNDDVRSVPQSKEQDLWRKPKTKIFKQRFPTQQKRAYLTSMTKLSASGPPNLPLDIAADVCLSLATDMCIWPWTEED